MTLTYVESDIGFLIVRSKNESTTGTKNSVCVDRVEACSSTANEHDHLLDFREFSHQFDPCQTVTGNITASKWQDEALAERYVATL